MDEEDATSLLVQMSLDMSEGLHHISLETHTLNRFTTKCGRINY